MEVHWGIVCRPPFPGLLLGPDGGGVPTDNSTMPLLAMASKRCGVNLYLTLSGSPHGRYGSGHSVATVRFWKKRSMDHGPWTRAHGPWSMDYGPWTMVCRPCSIDHGPWIMVHGPWSIDHSPWTMVHGPRSMVHGPWPVSARSTGSSLH